MCVDVDTSGCACRKIRAGEYAVGRKIGLERVNTLSVTTTTGSTLKCNQLQSHDARKINILITHNASSHSLKQNKESQNFTNTR
jgi:hypothetical protein